MRACAWLGFRKAERSRGLVAILAADVDGYLPPHQIALGRMSGLPCERCAATSLTRPIAIRRGSVVRRAWHLFQSRYASYRSSRYREPGLSR